MPMSEVEEVMQTHSWIWPEPYEIIFGTMASGLIFGLLIKFVIPLAKKALTARTVSIQAELDSGANDLASAEQEAQDIRQAIGDIASERARILAETNVQAEALLRDGRARLAQELVEIQERGQSEIVSIGLRVSDELRAEISRLSGAAIDQVVRTSLTDATQQELIENFISKVGASR